VNGRNNIDWDTKLGFDVEYIKNISFENDVKILFLTLGKVFKRTDVLVGSEFKGGKFIDQRKARQKAQQVQEDNLKV